MVHESLDRGFEQQWLKDGVTMIMGVDEAGRGPLAGPVVAAAAIVSPDVDIPGIQDSKATTEKQREKVYEQLVAHPGVHWAASVIDNTVIDDINILQATLLGMRTAAANVLAKHPHLAQTQVQCLIDGNKVPPNMPIARSESVIKGDAKVYSIAAASIIAKVTRDRIMLRLHEVYPQYNFKQHKGYPVSAHRAVLQEIGPCEEHRFSYSPVKIAADKHGVSPSPSSSSRDAGAGVGAEESYWAPKPVALFTEQDNCEVYADAASEHSLQSERMETRSSPPAAYKTPSHSQGQKQKQTLESQGCKSKRKANARAKTPVKSRRSAKKLVRKTPQKKAEAESHWSCSVQ